LQDLDSLAARIEQMVKLARQLQADRTALQARVKALEAERDQLGGRLQQRESEIQAMAGNLAEIEERMKTSQAQASQVQTQLQLELDQCRERCDNTERQLHESQHMAKQLSIVSEEARRQIDSILTRLLGPPQE